MQDKIRADMLKVKKMVSEVEIIIGKREGESELVNKLIDAQNLLTYCMSRLENAVVLPFKVGDTVMAEYMVVEVVHGKWKPYWDSEWQQPALSACSICKHRQITETNYCPNCGAKMDGERKCEDG